MRCPLHRLLVLGVLLAAAPAWAGGPFERPDTGPGGLDLTRWRVHGIVMLVQHVDLPPTRLSSTVYCLNMGTTETRVVYEFYTDGGAPDRGPVDAQTVTLPVTTTRGVTTAFRGFPAFGSYLIRIVYENPRARLHCQASTQDDASFHVVRDLEVLTARPGPRPRFR